MEVYEAVEYGTRRVGESRLRVVVLHGSGIVPVGIVCADVLIEVLYLVLAQSSIALETQP